MRGAPRTPRLPLAALAVSVAIGLAGCGSDEATTTVESGTGGGTTTAQAPPAKAQEARPERAEPAPRQDEPGRGGSSGEERAAAPPSREPAGPPPTVAGSLANEGTKRPAPGVPVRQGTDSSVQTFGLEAPASDRTAAARVLQAFLDARLRSDWALACSSYLSAPVKAQMRALAKGEGGDAAACVQVMAALAEGVPKSALRAAAEIEVLSMRVEGDRAIVIYRDGAGAPSTIPMEREEGAWKVAAAAGSELFLGASP